MSGSCDPKTLRLSLCDPTDSSPPGCSVHGFSRQEYCSALPFPPPGDLPDPGIKSRSPTLGADSLPPPPPSHQGSPVFLKGMFKVCCLKLGNFTWACFHSDDSTRIENAFISPSANVHKPTALLLFLIR